MIESVVYIVSILFLNLLNNQIKINFMLKSILPIFCAFSILTGCTGTSKNSDMKNDTEKENKMDTLASSSKNEMYMLVGTYTGGDSKGIYIYALDTLVGSSRYISEVDVENPSYLVLDATGKYVYAVSEDDDISKAAINAFSFDKEGGKLSFINKQLTGGAAPCHVNIDKSGKHVIVSNYNGGSLSLFDTNTDGSLNPSSRIINFEGRGVDEDRQKQPHIHFSQFSPDQKYLFADDLGTDKIHKFDIVEGDSTKYLSIGKPASFKVADGLGPRHLTFHPNGKYAYLITEMGGDVIVFDYSNGNLNQKQAIKADTLNAKGSADIHVSPDGKFVYASNRLKGDGIAIFSVNQTDGKLTKVGYQRTGIHPRNFAITPNGKFLLVANRDSDQIQVFARNTETGLLDNTNQDIIVGMPVCIQFASIN